MILRSTLVLCLIPAPQEASPQGQRVVEFPLQADAYNPARTSAWVFQSESGGVVVEYTPDGSLYAFAQFENEAKHGLEQVFYPDGRLFRERMFAGGNANGPVIEYFPDGTKSLEGTFVDGFFHGELRTYWPDGSLYQNGPMSNNVRHGTWQSWMPGEAAPFGLETWFNGQSNGQTILAEMDEVEFAYFQRENKRRSALLCHLPLWNRYLGALRAAPVGAWPRVIGLVALGEPLQRATVEFDFRRFDGNGDGSLSPQERATFGIQSGSSASDGDAWAYETFERFYRQCVTRAKGRLGDELAAG